MREADERFKRKIQAATRIATQTEQKEAKKQPVDTSNQEPPDLIKKERIASTKHTWRSLKRDIFALINGDNAEFNLRVDHGLHELVSDWLMDSTAPVFVNECWLNRISPIMDF